MSTKKHIIALSVRRQSGTQGALCMDPRNDVHELALDFTKLCVMRVHLQKKMCHGVQKLSCSKIDCRRCRR